MEPQKESNPNYLPYPPNPHHGDDEIDLRELFKALWKGKWIIIATTFVFAVGAVLYALSLPNIYKADALLAPAESSNGGGLSKMAGQLGGLAALAGVNLGAGESSQTDLAVQVMKSRKFIESFIDRHNLLVPLMATKDWNIAKNELIINEDIYDLTNEEWLRKAEGLLSSEPTSQEAYQQFVKKVFKINLEQESGLYKVSIEHYSPFIAQKWVDWLIKDINREMRNRAISEAQNNLKYLKLQLEKTSVAEMQSTFYKLIEEQMKSLMLAEVQEEFIFKTIDPAVVPEKKNEPRRAIICVLGTILGSVVGAVLVLILFITNMRNVKNETEYK